MLKEASRIIEGGKVYRLDYYGNPLVIAGFPDNYEPMLISAKQSGRPYDQSVQLVPDIDAPDEKIFAKMNANYFIMATGQHLGIRVGIGEEWEIPRQHAYWYFAVKTDGTTDVGMDYQFPYAKGDVSVACSPGLINYRNGQPVYYMSPNAAGTKDNPTTQSVLVKTKERYAFLICTGALRPEDIRTWAIYNIEGLTDLFFMDSGGSTCLQVGSEVIWGTSEHRPVANVLAAVYRDPALRRRIPGADSDLVDMVRWSPNFTAMTNKVIDRIVIHHTAGVNTAQAYLDQFMPHQRQAAPNYVIGVDGKIGQSVKESNRAWTTSSYKIDSRAVTIEVSNDKAGGDWHVSDLCIQKTIELCVDICKRNGIKRVTFIDGDKENSVLQMHRWWAATACPGQYLGSMFPYIAEKINAALEGSEEPQAKVLYCVQVGAFSKYANAVNMRNKLKKAGFNGYITKNADSEFYRVQVGAFAVKANASNYALELSSKGFDCYVTTKGVTI